MEGYGVEFVASLTGSKALTWQIYEVWPECSRLHCRVVARLVEGQTEEDVVADGCPENEGLLGHEGDLQTWTSYLSAARNCFFLGQLLQQGQSSSLRSGKEKSICSRA